MTSPPPPGAGPARPKSRGGRDGDDNDKIPLPPPPPADPEVIKNWVALPEKYGDPTKSGLTGEVKAGRPLDLKLD